MDIDEVYIRMEKNGWKNNLKWVNPGCLCVLKSWLWTKAPTHAIKEGETPNNTFATIYCANRLNWKLFFSLVIPNFKCGYYKEWLNWCKIDKY